MNINEYRKKDIKSLKNILNELNGKLFVLRFQISTGKTQEFSDIKKIKKEIAQINTIIFQKKFESNIINKKNISIKK